MIHIASSSEELVVRLAADFIEDKTPLITSAGFDPNSDFANLERQTFSLCLSAKTVAKIRAQVQNLYDELIEDCWPEGEILPFDMVRLDAFLEPVTDEIKIIELNTRNVGLHEVVEWMDATVAKTFGIDPVGSLNQRFVENQLLLHTSAVGADQPLLYMSPSYLPRWMYYAELERVYPSVVAISEPEQANYTETGVEVDGINYRAITRKLAWPAATVMKSLDKMGHIRILQPQWMQKFGLKDYLKSLSSPTILRTQNFNPQFIDNYKSSKDELVLKVTNAGNSKSVFLGAAHSPSDWLGKLEAAADQPKKWIVQDYYQPPKLSVIAHGKGAYSLPAQLGIFVLPCTDDPRQFDMDITVKAYAGAEKHFTFDPSGLMPDIWFGHVIKISDAPPLVQ